MPLEKSLLHDMIRDAFPDATVELQDLAGDDDHWALMVCSEQFRGKTRIIQHKMVYDALKGKMGGELHALQVKTRVPE